MFLSQLLHVPYSFYFIIDTQMFIRPTNQYSVSTVYDQQLPRIIFLRTLYHEIHVQLSRLEVPPVSWRRRLRLWLNRRKPPMRDYDISQNLSRLSEPAWVKWEPKPGVSTIYLYRGALSWRASSSGLTYPSSSVRPVPSSIEFISFPILEFNGPQNSKQILVPLAF